VVGPKQRSLDFEAPTAQQRDDLMYALMAILNYYQYTYQPRRDAAGTHAHAHAHTTALHCTALHYTERSTNVTDRSAALLSCARPASRLPSPQPPLPSS
jgi:hypothetical protein